MQDTRLESFPFDSKAAGTDDYGYPVYDRAVGASMLRQTFKQFFSNGVFGTPGTAFQISKGTGLNVNIAEGIAIINGAMSSIQEGGISVPLTDETTTVGTYAYGVFLRYNENTDKRSCYITVRKGEAGTNPTPPEPERSSPGIWELRLGYIVIPTGSSDLSSATVTNEKGLEYCPFAAPFEEIDVSAITSDFRASANEALTALLDYFNKYEDMVAAAVDGALAGQLQTQINQLKAQLDNFDLSESVDNETIAYGAKPGDVNKKLYVLTDGVLTDGSVTTNKMKDGSVTTEKLAEKCVSLSKLNDEALVLMGAFDWEKATAEQIASFLNSPVYEVSKIAKENGFKVSFGEIAKFKNLGIQSEFQDAKKEIEISGYGTVQFIVIGVDHDDLSDGSGKATFTLGPDHKAITNKQLNTSNDTTGGWASTSYRSWANTTLKQAFPSDLQAIMCEVKKKYCKTNGGATSTSNDFLFLYSEKELFGTTSYGDEGTQYDYWKRHNENENRVHYLGDSAVKYWLRSVYNSVFFGMVGGGGTLSNDGASYLNAVVPCFTIR